MTHWNRLVMRLVLAGIVAIMVFAPAATASAAYPRSMTASAAWRSPNNRIRPGDACVDTTTSVDVTQRAGQVQATVDVVEFDNCIVDDYGLVEEWYTIVTLPPGAFQMRRNLARASLAATINICDLHGGDCFDIAFDVVWKATGPTVHDQSGNVRPATADGQVTDGDRDLAPEPSFRASLASAP